MSVRSFHSVYMTGAVAAAALGCYLVSLRVASERAAVEGVESQILSTQRDIRMLQTEIGTRGRLGQLEQWNASALALSAPGANQFVADGFQLARLVKPEPKLEVEAPVVLAAAPAPQPQSAFDDPGDDAAPQPTSSPLLHQASLKVRIPVERIAKPAVAPVAAPATVKVPAEPKLASPAKVKMAAETKVSAPAKSAAAEPKKPALAAIVAKAVAQPKGKPAVAKGGIKLAEADPLAPLPSGRDHSDKPASAIKDTHGKK